MTRCRRFGLMLDFADFFAGDLAVALRVFSVEFFAEDLIDLESEAFEDFAGAASADCPTAGF